MSKQELRRIRVIRQVIGEKCGKTNNRAHTPEFKLRIKDIVQHRYADFSPTFIAEWILRPQQNDYQ